MSNKSYIAINWGGSNFRAYYLNEAGECVDSIQNARGINNISRNIMAELIHSISCKWNSFSHIYAAGTIGSTMGWTEVPYVRENLTAYTLAAKIQTTNIGSVKVNIIPGFTAFSPDGTPDVMRGEETELLGILALKPELNTRKSIIVMPGTHTKWVYIENGKVIHFYTSPTGELFDLLSSKGFLSSILIKESTLDSDFKKGFDLGIESGGGLPRLLFGSRSLSVLKLIDNLSASLRVRGILLGTELSDALLQYPNLHNMEGVYILGNKSLAKLYSYGFDRIECRAKTFDDRKAILSGFHQIHEAHIAYQKSIPS